MTEKERLIDRIFLFICKLFDLIDPESRKEKKEAEYDRLYNM